MEPRERLGLDLEAEAGRVAEGAEDASRVVLERALVKDADEPRVEVVPASGRVEDFAASGPFRRRARALMVKSRRRRSSRIVARLDGGEGAGAGVGLGAGSDEVDVMAGNADVTVAVRECVGWVTSLATADVRLVRARGRGPWRRLRRRCRCRAKGGRGGGRAEGRRRGRGAGSFGSAMRRSSSTRFRAAGGRAAKNFSMRFGLFMSGRAYCRLLP